MILFVIMLTMQGFGSFVYRQDITLSRWEDGFDSRKSHQFRVANVNAKITISILFNGDVV